MMGACSNKSEQAYSDDLMSRRRAFPLRYGAMHMVSVDSW